MLEKIFTHNESIIFYTNIFSLIKQILIILINKEKDPKNCAKLISNYPKKPYCRKKS